MQILKTTLAIAIALLLCACANISTDFKFDPTKSTGLVVGSISFESGLGKYYLVAESTSTQKTVDFGFGCSVVPCLEPSDDETFSRGELPKQRAGGFAVEVPEGSYRIVAWRVTKGSMRYHSSLPVSIEFRVERGMTSYLGNLHFDKEMENVKLRDRSSRDLPLLTAKYPVLRTAPLAFAITPGMEITKLGGEYKRSIHIEGLIFVPVRR